MNNVLLKDVIEEIEQFETENSGYSNDILGFKHWISDKLDKNRTDNEPYWEGKENGRSPDSAINTLIVHLNRYAKTYSKSAIYDSNFSTQDDFIYLINLKAFGKMTKMELIKKNVHDKPTGIQIINRLIALGYIAQIDSETDKRSKIIHITDLGLEALEHQMNHIRQATQIVTGNLTYSEKMDLIRILNKLEHFHKPIFRQNIEVSKLLNTVLIEFLPSQN